jgi:hypothetical protein
MAPRARKHLDIFSVITGPVRKRRDPVITSSLPARKVETWMA